MFRGLRLRHSSMIMWRLPDNPDSTLIKPSVWCHPVNTWKWRCMSLLVLSVKISSGSRHSELFLLRVHQSVSHSEPIICHLKLLKWVGLSWMSCDCDDIGFGCRRRKSTFLWLWFASICLVSCKSTVIVSPGLEFVPLVPPISSLCWSSQCCYLCVSVKERKRCGAQKVSEF